MIEKLVGPRNAIILRTWKPTIAAWGGTGLLCIIYFPDWKLILQYVPYVGGKYKKDDE